VSRSGLGERAYIGAVFAKACARLLRHALVPAKYQWALGPVYGNLGGAFMKNVDDWRPTKFFMQSGQLRASRVRADVAPASRFIVDLLAVRYQRLLRDHARGRLLDLGAGAVPLYEVYRELVDSVTCVDWSGSAHQRAHIDIDADLNLGLPLPNESFDTVLLTDVLEHIYRPHALVEEIGRVLAPRGKLLLTVPFFYWIHEAPHDYARYTSFMLRRLCSDSALTVEALEETGGSPEVILDMLGKHLGWSQTLASLHGALAPWVLRWPGVAAVSRYSRRWFPQGYVLVAQKR
jgi:SAM-dependent methyltransferase